MELNLQPEKFEEYQQALIEEITKTIMVKLVESGLERRQMEDLTASIAFSVASIIDNTAKIEAEGEPIRPYLTFQSEDNELIHCGENSYAHESVYSILKQLFEAEAE